MRKKSIGELGLVLLCTGLLLVATASAQSGVSSAKKAAANRAAASLSASGAPVAHDGSQGQKPDAAQASEPKPGWTPNGAVNFMQVQNYEKAVAAVKYGQGTPGNPRACNDCLAPDANLGDIGSVVYGYNISGNCAVEGKWYASFNGVATHIYHFDLCPQTPGTGSASEDVDLKICDSSCTILAGVDGLSTCSPVAWLPQDFQWTCTADGVYNVVIAPYNSYASHTCLGTAATTFTLNYYSEFNPCEGNYPPNDTCEQLPAYYGGAIPTLTAGVPYSFTGDNTCAQPDCTQFPMNNAWEAFTLTGSPTGLWDITLKYCMTSPAFGNAWLNLMVACPCDGFTVAGTFDTTSCGDGNVTVHWLEGEPDGTYYYPVLNDPANSAVGPYIITVTAVYHVPIYCAASGGCDEFISRVQVGTIDNATACSGYADYTALSTDMQVGTGYPITVTNGPPTYSTDQCLVWVDWNRDLDFADAGETFTMAGSPGNGPYTGTITPPIGTTAGATRMRVRINYAATPPACGTTTYGEVEDYTVNVLPAPPGGACCFPDGSCTEVPNGAACTGNYLGDGTDCTPNPCPQLGACCIDMVCQFTGFKADCDAAGGAWYVGQTCPEFVCPAACQHRIDLWDCFGDGWNGCTLDVLVNGNPVLSGITLASGYGPATFNFLAATGDTIQTVFHPASYPTEPYYYIYNGAGTQIGADGIDGTGCYVQPTGITVIGDCTPPELGACCYGDGTCADLFPADCAATGGTYQGAGTECVTTTCLISNDNCVNAYQIGDVTNLPWTTVGMTFDGGGTCMTTPNIWYCYTASCTGTATISLCGSAFDTKLAVYDGCTCNPLGPSLGCNDDSGPACSGLQSSLAVPVIAGYQYLIEVGGYSGAGTGVLTTSCLQAPQGACCLLTGCIIDYQLSCVAAGGVYLGNDTQCGGADCNNNGIDDACDIANGTSHDCNNNGVPDECDIASGYSQDVDANGVPDECDPDCNENGVIDACELPGGCATGNCGTVYPEVCGSGRDCQPDGVLDACQIGGGGGDRSYVYQWDDGTHENSIGLTYGGEIAWMNHFTVVANAESIISVSVAWASVANGTASAVYVWSDPNGDGDPTDAHVLAFAPTVVANTDTDILTTVSIPAAHIGPPGTSFFAGALITHPSGTYPAPVDQNSVLHGQSWIAGSTTGNLDPDNLGGGDVPPINIDTIAGLEGNWLVRAEGGTGGGHDCNGNGIPDECDVPPICQGEGCSTDCNANLIPDECETDCNGNGRPDDCDIASGYSLDCNGNGIPDECDLASGASQDCNGNTIPDECDIASGFSLDCNNNGIPDSCDIANCPLVDPAHPEYGTQTWCRDCQGDGIPDGCQLYDAPVGRPLLQYDDGTSEDSLGNATYAHQICWIHHFTVTQPGTVDDIRTTFGTPAYAGGSGLFGGEQFNVYIWSDPNGDGDPTDAVLIATNYDYVDPASIDTDVFQVVSLPSTLVTGSFFIGVSIENPGGYAAPMDENGVLAHESWGCYSTTGTFDPNNLATTLFNLDDIGYPANWMLRGHIVYGPPPHDCNQNGVPDICDIPPQFGGVCDRSPSDIAGPCGTDWNHDGIPDSCQMCGDINADSTVNIDDYYVFLDAFGTCVGDQKYNAACDMDGDQCITLADYSAWRVCYKMANGFDFTVPKFKAIKAPSNTSGNMAR